MPTCPKCRYGTSRHLGDGRFLCTNTESDGDGYESWSCGHEWQEQRPPDAGDGRPPAISPQAVEAFMAGRPAPHTTFADALRAVRDDEAAKQAAERERQERAAAVNAHVAGKVRAAIDDFLAHMAARDYPNTTQFFVLRRRFQQQRAVRGPVGWILATAFAGAYDLSAHDGVALLLDGELRQLQRWQRYDVLGGAADFNLLLKSTRREHMPWQPTPTRADVTDILRIEVVDRLAEIAAGRLTGDGRLTQPPRC